jgi:two-component system response regulator
MPEEQTILLVEDNDDDAELTLRAFKEAQIQSPIVRVEDGVAALDYLVGPEHGRAPAVLLLDLNLPRKSGLEVLRAVRADPRLKYLPVVILTSSTRDADRLAAYDHQANSYVQKPVNYQQFVAAARQLGTYWTQLNMHAPQS